VEYSVSLTTVKVASVSLTAVKTFPPLMTAVTTRWWQTSELFVSRWQCAGSGVQGGTSTTINIGNVILAKDSRLSDR
jgi:hypothetical protein